MRYVLFLWCFLFISQFSFSNGLPPNGCDESILFTLDPASEIFHAVTPGFEIPDHIYVRWSILKKYWVWSQARDRRIILEGSKVQGWRLGRRGQKGRNWFRLGPNLTEWKEARDRMRPGIWCLDYDFTRRVCETVPDNWETWGAELDPHLSCQLRAVPPLAKVGEQIELVLSTTGNITSVLFDGVSVPVGYGHVVAASSPGTYTSEARVSGPEGSASCRVSYTFERQVILSPSCELRAVPEKIKLGEKVELQLSVRGDVTAMEIDGNSIALGSGRLTLSPTTTGNFTSRAKVRGPGGEGTCSASYTVEKQVTPSPLRCEITVTPSSVVAGQSVLVTMKTTGPVREANLDGIAVDYPTAQILKSTVTTGKFTINGFVRSLAERENCSASYEVRPR